MRIVISALAAATFVLAACGQSTAPPAPPAEPQGPPPLVLWSQIPADDIAVPEGVFYSVAQVNGAAVAEISAVPADATPTARTGGVSIRLPRGWEQQASGKQIRVTVRAAAADPGASLGVAYTTMEVGNSGWRQFELTPEATDYSFAYNVDTLREGNGDFIGFRNYGEGRVQILAYRVEVLGPSTGAPITQTP